MRLNPESIPVLEAGTWLGLAVSAVTLVPCALLIALSRFATWKPHRMHHGRVPANCWLPNAKTLSFDSIATDGSTERAFSVDSSMTEALLMATKKPMDVPRADTDTILYIDPRQRPESLV